MRPLTDLISCGFGRHRYVSLKSINVQVWHKSFIWIQEVNLEVATTTKANSDQINKQTYQETSFVKLESDIDTRSQDHVLLCDEPNSQDMLMVVRNL